MYIRSKAIYTTAGCIAGVIHVEDGVIVELYPYDFKTMETILNFDEYRILPGIIDIHTHGFRRCNAQAVDKKELTQLCKELASVGVTSFLPTAGEHFEDEFKNLRLLKEVIEAPICGARMLGIHMEGPFLNPKRRGAFTLEQLLPCDVTQAKRYVDAAGGHLLYISMAPELDPQGILIRYLTSQGVIVSGAHTCASYETFTKGIDMGIRASTHTGNGMQQMDRRDVGAMGCALLSDQIYCEVICDFHHINPKMLEIMFRIKPKGMQGMIMISDSGQLSGNLPGVYEKYGQVRIIDEHGLIHLEDGTIAGSSHPLLYGIKNLERKLGKAIEDIIWMTSKNPATLLGLDHKKGSIAKGMDADFLVMDNDYQVVSTFVEGSCVYSTIDLR